MKTFKPQAKEIMNTIIESNIYSSKELRHIPVRYISINQLPHIIRNIGHYYHIFRSIGKNRTLYIFKKRRG